MWRLGIYRDWRFLEVRGCFMNSRLFHILNKYCFNKKMSIYELKLTHKMLVKIRMSRLVQTIF